MRADRRHTPPPLPAPRRAAGISPSGLVWSAERPGDVCVLEKSGANSGTLGDPPAHEPAPQIIELTRSGCVGQHEIYKHGVYGATNSVVTVSITDASKYFHF